MPLGFIINTAAVATLQLMSFLQSLGWLPVSLREYVKSLPWPMKLCMICAHSLSCLLCSSHPGVCIVLLLWGICNSPFSLLGISSRPIPSFLQVSAQMSSLNTSPTTLNETIPPTPTPGHAHPLYLILSFPKHYPCLKCSIFTSLCVFVCLSPV